MPRPRTPLQERFDKHVIRTDGCWEWNGSTSQGYAILRARAEELPGMNGTDRAARISWFLAHGPIPAGMTIDHICHNGSGCHEGDDCPHRRCTNPEHLQIVTAKENMLRGNNPLAMNARKTHCKRGHPLSGENLRIYKSGSRACKQCQRERDERRERKPPAERPSGNANSAKTHCPRGHEYDEQNTYVYTSAGGGKHRLCRRCMRQAEKRSRT